MDKLVNLFKVLSDETRIRILNLLYHRKLCVCQMQGILEESQPKISKHLSKLKDKGFVKDERQEQFIFYYLDNENQMLKGILDNIISSIDDYSVLKKDIERLPIAEECINEKIKSQNI
ncbi:winged helix-turn-helix transcriptional regulator [Clostridium sp. D2Q-14]|uniref:ArsR/SmtB family transcription factor n=1 Tax=Anaeromonas gelatinilytica TaxID=2683194 RepID=UPI00193C8003|nr:metalloregulator ArsR/SmtB family transcription factor [Anaeromonas gelatinilytica]MBS4534098.1 winged helix-turn-helix transcriptional regulator [Anaeromonas gelatinilytica]